MSPHHWLDHHKDAITAIKDILTIAGVVVGAVYFFFRVRYQRTYQQLSQVISLVPVDSDQHNVTAEITLQVTNNADCRINLLNPRFSVFPCDPYKVGNDPNGEDNFITKDELFYRNTGTLKDLTKGSMLISEYDRFSVDAKSSVVFSALVRIPMHVKLVVIEGCFGPDLTDETYKAVRFVPIKAV
jgi:hypothetical protein